MMISRMGFCVNRFFENSLHALSGVRVQKVQKVQRVQRVQRVVVAADAADFKKGTRLAPRVV